MVAELTFNSSTQVHLPTLLSETVRELAWRGLNGEWGHSMQAADRNLKDQLPGEGCSPETRYAAAVKLIAQTAPLRLLPEERIIGSATYREAAFHETPILGEASTSHLTLNFAGVLESGYRGVRERINARLARGGLDEKGIDLLNNMLVCLEAAQIWHDRYVALLHQRIMESSGAQREHYKTVLANLLPVPENPPQNFYQAVQSLGMMFDFQRLCGNWSAIGRIDQMLGKYLKRDLAAGLLNLDDAREILAHFWVKGTEWIGSHEVYYGGDAQHYQNIILSGIDVDGNDVTNEVTYLVLDIVAELHISDFPVGLRINKNTSDLLLRKVAEVQRLGGGIVSIYNEEVVLQALEKLGIPDLEARGFTNDGCWEILIPGKTAFIYSPFDMLVILQRVLGLEEVQVPLETYGDFESLYQAFSSELETQLETIMQAQETFFNDGRPATLISLFIDDCIEKGRGYYERGAHYIFTAPHAGGMADVCNSLLVIEKLVFEEKRLTLRQLVDILKNNWQDYDLLRQEIISKFEFFGNDDDDADQLMQRLFDDYTGYISRCSQRDGVYHPAGISTFGREIEWLPQRKAAAHGFHRGDLLATNFSPTPGTDKRGPTAAIKSYCKMDFTRLPNGGTLELKIHPTGIAGEDGLESLVSLLKVFISLGGFYLNIDVIDSSMLVDAQKHPERYPNLAVRISGWCARFNTLGKEWQDMVIQRTQQYL